MSWKIPLFKIYWDKEDVRLVKETIRRGMFWAIGPNIDEFEKMLAGYLGRKHVVVFNSGTSALQAVLMAYGVKPGDEVIVPSFTFIATANAPIFVGARPVFADIEEKTFGLDPADVRRKITPRTRAIIPVHYGGCPCLIEDIKKIAMTRHIILIEDAAESLGASVNGKKIGSFGDAAVLSFCANKVITTGEGGAIATDSEDIYEKLKLTRSHGRAENANYFASTENMDYITLGYNFRMSDITAALGVAQMKKLDDVTEMRRQKAYRLTARLAGIKEIETPYPPEGFRHVFQMYSILVKSGQANRDALKAYLAEKGIMTKVYFPPVHLTHFYKNVQKYNCKLPVTEQVSRQVLTLPLYPGLTEADIKYITDSVSNFFRGK
jgi:perosamine synthetase